MSLINQMLKDLARRSKPLPGPDVILSGLLTERYSRSKRNKFQYWFIGGCLLFLMFTAPLIIRPYFSKHQQQDYVTATSKVVSVLPPSISESQPKTVDAAEIPPLKTVSLTGITMQTQKEMTTVRLLLNQNPLYRVTSYNKQQLMIVLENTRLVANLPQIDTINSAIKIMRMTNKADGSLKIIMILNAGAELNHLALNESNKLPELQIDLAYKNTTGNAAIHNIAQGDVAEEQQISSIKKISYDSSVEDEYQQAMLLSTRGHDDEAINRLTKFLIKHPEYVSARKSLVSLLLKIGNVDEAHAVINTGLQLQPLYAPYVQLKAQILVAMGRLKQALSLLETEPPPLEENPDYHAFIAALYQRQNKPILAEKLYERLLKLQPDNSIWWLGLGVARESLSKNKAALAAYQKADNTDNLSPELKVYVDTRIQALMIS